MSMGKSHQSSQSNQDSESHLDPDIKSALMGNWQAAQDRFSGMQYKPLTGESVLNWMNPYGQQVIDTSNASLDRTRQQTIQQGHASAAGQGAFGGDRTAVLDSLTNNDFAHQSAQMEAQLRSAGYDKALSTAQSENQAQNQWPLLIQQILNSSLGLAGNPTLGTSSGASNGSGSSWNFGLGGGG